jgi:hypothetical protein
MISIVSYGGDEDLARKDRNFRRTIDNVIKILNNESSATPIKFSPSMEINIKNYGYNNFLNFHRTKCGKINSITSCLFFDEYARLQISTEKGRLTMLIAISPDGAVGSLRMIDPDPIIPVPERNSTLFRLPFRGEWLITSGGAIPEINHHMVNNNDRGSCRAVDFVIKGPNGAEFTEDGSKNEHYYAFGKDVLAVADGEVVTVIDGVPDNRPQTHNPLSTGGNVVLVKHANYEYSLYAHLKLNSISVKKGQKVLAGQTIGLCGNSGASNGPHIHFDLSNSEVRYDATGFTPYFQNVIVARQGSVFLQKDYTPLRDDKVKPQE